MEDKIKEFEEVIDYSFSDRPLLERALTHASLRGAERVSNERLEFLGDSVLGLSVCDHLFRRFPKSTEGELSEVLLTSGRFSSSSFFRSNCKRPCSSCSRSGTRVAGTSNSLLVSAARSKI